jgi:hypothetical protein
MLQAAQSTCIAAAPAPGTKEFAPDVCGVGPARGTSGLCDDAAQRRERCSQAGKAALQPLPSPGGCPDSPAMNGGSSNDSAAALHQWCGATAWALPSHRECAAWNRKCCALELHSEAVTVVALFNA